jgi:hypothetical protein
MMKTKSEFIELLCAGYFYGPAGNQLVFVGESNELLDAHGIMEQMTMVKFFNAGIPADYI